MLRVGRHRYRRWQGGVRHSSPAPAQMQSPHRPAIRARRRPSLAAASAGSAQLNPHRPASRRTAASTRSAGLMSGSRSKRKSLGRAMLQHGPSRPRPRATEKVTKSFSQTFSLKRAECPAIPPPPVPGHKLSRIHLSSMPHRMVDSPGDCRAAVPPRTGEAARPKPRNPSCPLILNPPMAPSLPRLGLRNTAQGRFAYVSR